MASLYTALVALVCPIALGTGSTTTTPYLALGGRIGTLWRLNFCEHSNGIQVSPLGTPSRSQIQTCGWQLEGTGHRTWLPNLIDVWLGNVKQLTSPETT